MVQWLGLHISTAEGPGSIPGWRTKILQVGWRGQNKKNLESYHPHFDGAKGNLATYFEKMSIV